MYTMKNYVQVSDLKEAYELKKKNKNNVILGGSLWLKMGSRDLVTGIDLCNLGLNRIEEVEDKIVMGCMCSLRDLEIHPSLHREFGGSFQEALKHIVGVQFRNTATLGGSVFPRFGFSDILTLLSVLNCDIELYQQGKVSVKEFIRKSPDEDILVRIIVKKDQRKVSYQTIRMTETDFGILNCAVALKDHTFTIALGATPAKAKVVDVKYTDRFLKEEKRGEFLDGIVEQFTFGTNMRGSKEYRKSMAKVLIQRAMEEVLGSRG